MGAFFPKNQDIGLQYIQGDFREVTKIGIKIKAKLIERSKQKQFNKLEKPALKVFLVQKIICFVIIFRA